MDYTQFIIPAAIIVYAVFEYQRREQVHRERMELLKRDIEPQPLTRQPNLTTIATTATVTVLLLAISIFFIVLGIKAITSGGALFLLFSMYLILLMIFLIAILRRDIKLYRNNKQRLL